MNFRKTKEEGLEIAAKRRQEHIDALKEQNAKVLENAKAQGLDTPSLTLEIGCGKGHYLSAYAANFPQEICIGIDLITERIKDGERRAKNLNARNAFFIKAEASEYLESLPKNVKLAKIFIMFSDPWPKKRHFKRRLIQPEFLDLLAKFSQPNATLHFRTDHKEYFDWTQDLITQNPHWTLQENSTLPFETISQFQRILPDFNTLIAQLGAS